MYVTDTLSRANIPGDSKCGAAEDMEVMVHAIDSQPMTPEKRQKFEQETTADPVMARLKAVIMNGWPKSRKAIHSDLQPYWNVRDQLHEASGLLFNGERLIVPFSLRRDMLSLVHESHLRSQTCKARAREIVYCPGITRDISTVEKCEICIALRPQQTKEPLHPHEVPDRPWQRLATDIWMDGLFF